MTTQEKIEIMQAYVEGRVIQVRLKTGTEWENLVVRVEPKWNWEILDYRIKPEDKYRPYKDTDEMIADFKKRFNAKVPPYAMPMIWIKSKKDGFRFLLSTFGTVSVEGINFSDLLDEYTYLDGSPCGIKED